MSISHSTFVFENHYSNRPASTGRSTANNRKNN